MALNILPVNIRAEASQVSLKTAKNSLFISLFPVDCVFYFRDSSFTLFYVLQCACVLSVMSALEMFYCNVM